MTNSEVAEKRVNWLYTYWVSCDTMAGYCVINHAVRLCVQRRPVRPRNRHVDYVEQWGFVAWGLFRKSGYKQRAPANTSRRSVSRPSDSRHSCGLQHRQLWCPRFNAILPLPLISVSVDSPSGTTRPPILPVLAFSVRWKTLGHIILYKLSPLQQFKDMWWLRSRF